MKITLNDRDTVLSTVRQNPAGLSISDVSRKNSINRNKIAVIIEILEKEDLVTCTTRYNSKMVTPTYRSAYHTLLDIITEPSLIIDENLLVIQVNKAFLDLVPAERKECIGKRIDEISWICLENMGSNLNSLLDGRDGEKNTIFGSSGDSTCTAIRITLGDEKPGIFIVFHPLSPGICSVGDEMTGILIDALAKKIPGIRKDHTFEDVFGMAVSCIHDGCPDDIVFSLMVDEPGRQGMFNAIIPSRTTSKTVHDAIIGLMEKKMVVPIREESIREYKTTLPQVHDSITDIFQIPVEGNDVRDLIRVLPKGTNTDIGIILDDSLVGIIGILSVNERSQSVVHGKILSLVSASLIPLCMVCRMSDEIHHTSQMYQEQYKRIYSLLTEKTEQVIHHSSESLILRSLLGAILDTMDISLITTSQDGHITFINQTAVHTYQIDINRNLSGSYLTEVIPHSLAGSLMEGVSQERCTDDLEPGTNLVIDMDRAIPISWLCMRYPRSQSFRHSIYIGEKNPAPFISYLNSLDEF